MVAFCSTSSAEGCRLGAIAQVGGSADFLDFFTGPGNSPLRVYADFLLAAEIIFAKRCQSEVMALLDEAIKRARRHSVLPYDDRGFGHVSVTVSELALDSGIMEPYCVVLVTELAEDGRRSARSTLVSC